MTFDCPQVTAQVTGQVAGQVAGQVTPEVGLQPKPDHRQTQLAEKFGESCHRIVAPVGE